MSVVVKLKEPRLSPQQMEAIRVLRKLIEAVQSGEVDAVAITARSPSGDLFAQTINLRPDQG